MKIAFRVDASAAIGTGHLRRCLSLAQALRDLKAEICFLTRDLGLNSNAIVAEHGFVGRSLGAPDGICNSDPEIPHSAWAQVSQQQDISESIEALEDFTPDWIVIDTYAFDARWHEAMREAMRCRIAVIDDLADRALSADLLVDQNYAPDHRAKYADVLTKQTRILGGPRYAMLGPAYADAAAYEFKGQVQSIGVFMGGVDKDNHSAMVLDALDRIGFSGGVEIATTSANPNLDLLSDRVRVRANTSVSVDLPDLASFFTRHDLQIGAGGGASWERCRVGVPTLLVALASNQMAVAPLLAAAGVAAYVESPCAERLGDEIAKLMADAPRRRTLSEKSRKMVDGLGAKRAALAMLGSRIHIRRATQDDAQLMFEWRGDATTRAVSREAGELDWENHKTWLSGVLADPARKLYVGEIGDLPVGVIRFDFSEEARAEVSLYLDPSLHGLGLGPHMLLAGEDAANVDTVDATVLEENHASHRLFEACSYARTGPTTWIKQRRFQNGLSHQQSAS